MDLVFKKGILGFENYNEFIIKDVEENDVFKILEAKDDRGLSLAILSPFDVKEDYKVELSEETIENLGIESEEDVIIYTTVTLNSDMTKTTTNLRAPIIINQKNCLAEQIILSEDNYKIKHPIKKG